MSDSSDDDFFMALPSEDDEAMRRQIQDVFVESSTNKTVASANSDNNDEEVALESVGDAEFAVAHADEKPIISSPNFKRQRSSRLSRQNTEDHKVISIDDSSDLSSKNNSRSSSFNSDSRPEKQIKPTSIAADEVFDENDEFFKQISKGSLAKRTPSLLSAEKENLQQSKRIFNIKFISKLDGTINKSVRVKVLGKFTFSKILPSALEGLIKAYKIPTVMKSIYTVDNVSMYWNNAKLLSFMTCNSLNIKQEFENEISNVDIMLVSKELGKNMEMMSEMAIYRDEQILSDNRNPETAHETDKERSADLVIEEFEKELADVGSSEMKVNNHDTIEIGDESDDEEVMKVSLVGQDNKKIIVNVRGTTPLSRLVEYYRVQKQLSHRTKLQLLFDDDELNLSQTVGEQDIEDEDMIDVVILK